MNILTVVLFCLFCSPSLLQKNVGQNQPNNYENDKDPKWKGNQSGYPPDQQQGEYNGQNAEGEFPQGNQEQNEEKDVPKDFCFANSTKEVKRILNICRCDVYERFQTFVGPNLSPIFQIVAQLFGFKPQQIGKGQKKESCKKALDKLPVLKGLYSFKNYGFFQVKVCFWNRLNLIVDGQAKWENLIDVLHYFHMADEKKQNITDIIKNCNETATEDEGDDEQSEEEEAEEEEEDYSKLTLDKLPAKLLDLQKKVAKAVEKSKRGGMNKPDFKVGKCIKEQLDTICRDFLTNGANIPKLPQGDYKEIKQGDFDGQQGNNNQQFSG